MFFRNKHESMGKGGEEEDHVFTEMNKNPLRGGQ